MTFIFWFIVVAYLVFAVWNLRQERRVKSQVRTFTEEVQLFLRRNREK